MEDYFDLEKVKAKVYLLADGDQQNMAMVTDDQLLIIRNGKRHIFDMYTVKTLETGSKRFLFPLFLGAVLAPFSFIAYFSNIFHPIIHLISTLLGLLLFFIGWIGKPTFSIISGKADENYFYLPVVSKNLHAFIEYVNSQLGNRETNGLGDLVFVEKEGNSNDWLFDRSDLQDEYFPKFGYSFPQVVSNPSLKEKVLAIDPQLAEREIKFEYDHDMKIMRPMIRGPVNKSSLLEEVNWPEN